MSYSKIGDVLVKQGNLAEALTSFRDGLAIRERAALAEPGNIGLQRELAVSYRKIREVQSRAIRRKRSSRYARNWPSRNGLHKPMPPTPRCG